jgi:hypothetical protein
VEASKTAAGRESTFSRQSLQKSVIEACGLQSELSAHQERGIVAVETPDRWGVGRTRIFYIALLCTLEVDSLYAINYIYL